MLVCTWGGGGGKVGGNTECNNEHVGGIIMNCESKRTSGEAAIVYFQVQFYGLYLEGLTRNTKILS
jgi:hypothetical protein